MGGEDSSLPECSSNDSPESSSSGGSGAGAPIRFLVFLHKAVRAELEELRRLAADAVVGGARRREVVVAELRRRLEFLKSVYSYHCAAEDEVIFLALDVRVENIACTYSLEHNSINCTLDYIFSCLYGILNDQENASLQLQELMFHIGALQESIRQHMIKEEKQVFPMLISQFSDEEQAWLVWQFMCSVPLILMEELFPWLACFLSRDEQMELRLCVRKIVPRDKLLQEVVGSWLDVSIQRPLRDCIKYDTSSRNLSELGDLKNESTSCGESYQWEQNLQTNVKDVLCNGLLQWHCAIRCEFKEILDKVYGMKSKKLSNMALVITQINFMMDVLMFYSHTLERIFYPLLEDISILQRSLSCMAFSHTNEIEGLQQILYDATQINLANPKFVEMLYNKVESVVLATSEHLSFQETEVFPLISKNCDHEMQQELLFRSLRMLPLGLLKCVVTWFSSHLPKDNLRSILCGIKESGILKESFASLLHEWIRMGYSGKTTMQHLQEMFNGWVPYLSEHIREGEDPCKKSKDLKIKHCSADRSRSFLSNSLSKRFHVTQQHGTLYSSGINLLIFTSGASKSIHPSSRCPTEAISTSNLGMRPMDHIYYFHKALRKDLESLILDTTKLTDNLGLLVEFVRHFQLLQSLYELHSETEDEIAFPAMEAKQMAPNLTQSYHIDHKLEAECFDRVSGILGEMSKLYHTVSGSTLDPQDPALVKYKELCIKLQDSCKSLTKVLNDHMHREEIELWPLFGDCFSIEEQEKIVGLMLGRTREEILQDMIVWFMASLTSEELHAMITLWRKAAKYTMFDEWLEAWWGGMNSYAFANEHKLNISATPTMGSLDTVKISMRVPHNCRENFNDESVRLHDDSNTTKVIKKREGLDVDSQNHKSSEYLRFFSEKKEKHKRDAKPNDVNSERKQLAQMVHKAQHQNEISSVHQVELEAAIRKVSQDSSVSLQEKTRIIQNLMTSHWIATQPSPDSDNVIKSEPGKLPGQFPAYRDTGGLVFGCKHYKQNCKLVAPCCNKLFTCRRCHDEVADHLMDRKSTTQMMCMKCLEVQSIGPTCSTPSCNKYPMARYYCKICRLFDDEREIYHCPYCNICRVGKGLGIDYFHCMKCNACMGRSVSVHKCREKCFEDVCPICHEDMFTSSTPIKGLACGTCNCSSLFSVPHQKLLSELFYGVVQEYTCMHYTCPVCSKSLGNMQVYFEMLDALLAEEKMPDEMSMQTQVSQSLASDDPFETLMGS
ncbi:hypothetical protein Cgig2_006176 [Carnegiea gigantea]|uniref:Zinc finger protein n=1 Tax=Carnegiea gigantea TaxID=171969 RepID=A0A9Q1QSW4_9CARY|nr:hypothetical protein Cgig2_006176 [Carnegiea gigantea]